MPETQSLFDKGGKYEKKAYNLGFVRDSGFKGLEKKKEIVAKIKEREDKNKARKDDSEERRTENDNLRTAASAGGISTKITNNLKIFGNNVGIARNGVASTWNKIPIGYNKLKDAALLKEETCHRKIDNVFSKGVAKFESKIKTAKKGSFFGLGDSLSKAERNRKDFLRETADPKSLAEVKGLYNYFDNSAELNTKETALNKKKADLEANLANLNKDDNKGFRFYQDDDTRRKKDLYQAERDSIEGELAKIEKDLNNIEDERLKNTEYLNDLEEKFKNKMENSIKASKNVIKGYGKAISKEGNPNKKSELETRRDAEQANLDKMENEYSDVKKKGLKNVLNDPTIPSTPPKDLKRNNNTDELLSMSLDKVQENLKNINQNGQHKTQEDFKILDKSFKSMAVLVKMMKDDQPSLWEKFRQTGVGKAITRKEDEAEPTKKQKRDMQKLATAYDMLHPNDTDILTKMNAANGTTHESVLDVPPYELHAFKASLLAQELGRPGVDTFEAGMGGPAPDITVRPTHTPPAPAPEYDRPPTPPKRGERSNPDEVAVLVRNSSSKTEPKPEPKPEPANYKHRNSLDERRNSNATGKEKGRAE